ncbi:S-adenosylmethionine:tRNA ribosyltransferase-isomerase [Siccationidurans soli]|uniref:S-adenosylmethionine:tRNA ribosyltransferase-isomerase n=2 Tax=Hymenobacter negativus TaxID=2795026 RepID=A0ABS3QPD7_9BACT|nr:S-adenosylmethionine:tRNA ribosyltransferase-isomerase [Hymenobacter negativus]MBO2013153.1 S-adenosylmethionine:tRNA ribosyltransferase-isomerase [Hymenobacter negativus]
MNPDPRQLSINDFTYPLPPERIAPEPLPDRAASRLLVSRAGTISDQTFRDLPNELPAGALLIFNDTRVVRARLLARRPTGGQVELFCLEPVAPHRSLELALQQTGHCTWRCLVGNGRRWKEGPVTLDFETSDGQTATLWAERQVQEAGTALIDFRWTPAELPFAEVLRAAGHLPLPPYIARPDTAADAVRYQTVYAAAEGAVAAPTAGLHFTPEILTELRDKGFETGHVTLHVGAGTFQPVKADRMADHPMHTEPILVTAALLRQLLAHRPRPVIAVGTTSLRTLETLYWLGVGLLQQSEYRPAELLVTQWQPYEMAELAASISPEAALTALLSYLDAAGTDTLQASTRLLIAPGYQFRLVQGLITNFHQPESTLLLLVAALLGPGWQAVYEHALSHGYRFLSYGDSSLLLPS